MSAEFVQKGHTVMTTHLLQMSAYNTFHLTVSPHQHWANTLNVTAMDPDITPGPVDIYHSLLYVSLSFSSPFSLSLFLSFSYTHTYVWG